MSSPLCIRSEEPPSATLSAAATLLRPMFVSHSCLAFPPSQHVSLGSAAAATREGPVSFWPALNAAHFACLLPSTLLSHSRVSRLRKELQERIPPVRSQSKDFYALANTSSSLFVSHATKRACATQILSSTQDSSWLFWFLTSRELRSRKRESCRGVHLRG